MTLFIVGHDDIHCSCCEARWRRSTNGCRAQNRQMLSRVTAACAQQVQRLSFGSFTISLTHVYIFVRHDSFPTLSALILATFGGQILAHQHLCWSMSRPRVPGVLIWRCQVTNHSILHALLTRQCPGTR